MRFPAEQRLRRQRDFRAAREQGRRIDCGGFTFWYLKRSSEPAKVLEPATIEPKSELEEGPTRPRVGVVASTAAVGSAVRRNRAKRRLREVFRRNQSLVPMDIDLLLVAKSSLNRLEYQEIEKKFVEACARAFRYKA
jgi:ribonuclease P protein component